MNKNLLLLRHLSWWPFTNILGMYLGSPSIEISSMRALMVQAWCSTSRRATRARVLQGWPIYSDGSSFRLCPDSAQSWHVQAHPAWNLQVTKRASSEILLLLNPRTCLHRPNLLFFTSICCLDNNDVYGPILTKINFCL